MKIAFTICSNNYLAQAKTLGDSFLKYHPEYQFIIGLVDKWSNEIDICNYAQFLVIPVSDLNIDNFSDLVAKFNITELNTSVKPSYFNYLFKKFNADNIIYLDPDILVLSRFFELLEILDKKNIVITPHICSPIDDDFAPTDYHTIRGGVFNLGFIALSDFENVKDFLSWWHARVTKFGFSDFSLNMFYDQIWINYVPAFYDNYQILKHFGYNMANWNLHERYLNMSEQEFYINDKVPLRFFHFSSYRFNKPHIICSYLTRYDFTSRPDLVPLFDIYQELLAKNGIEKIDKLKPFYQPELEKVSIKVSFDKRTLIEKILSRIRRSGKVLVLGHE